MKEILAPGPTNEMMSSLDIAELTEKKHKNVVRDIKSLINQSAISRLSFEPSTYKNDRGKEYPMYLLNFEATMTLITGYDAKRRSKVISRWVELEKKEQDPVAALLAMDKSQILQLAADQAKQLEEVKPKAAGFDRIARSDGLTCITDTAKTLQIRPKDLFDWLSENKWIYRRPGGKGWVAYQKRLQQGVLHHRVTTFSTDDGRDRIKEQVLVTAKGLTRLAESLAKEGAICFQ